MKRVRAKIEGKIIEAEVLQDNPCGNVIAVRDCRGGAVYLISRKNVREIPKPVQRHAPRSSMSQSTNDVGYLFGNRMRRM